MKLENENKNYSSSTFAFGDQVLKTTNNYRILLFLGAFRKIAESA
jgi:hypothetical protein